MTNFEYITRNPETLADNILNWVTCDRCPVHNHCIKGNETRGCDVIIEEWLNQPCDK